LDFSEAGQRVLAPGKVRFILPNTLFLLFRRSHFDFSRGRGPSFRRAAFAFKLWIGDAQALSALHDMLRYVQRELRFLDAPAHEAAASVGKAPTSVKAALRERSGRKRAPRR
jgi:hypothetical protein